MCFEFLLSIKILFILLKSLPPFFFQRKTNPSYPELELELSPDSHSPGT
jgi:hypothetical protein